MPNAARITSYVFAGLAVTMLITSVFLLIFIRDTKTTVVTITPSNVPNPTQVPQTEVKLQPFNTGQEFNPVDFTSIVSPITSTTASIISVSITSPNPFPDPGEVPFEQTIGLPLQIPPQGFGWTAFTPDAQQWFTSFENGFSLFGQYNFVTEQSVSKFEPFTDAYKSGQNFIYFNSGSHCPNSGSSADPTINEDASALGSVGYASIATSTDGVRLYVAYRQPFMGGSDTAIIFPLLQLSSRVAVFTRPLDTSGTSLTPKSSSPNWSYSCVLSLANPFGSQVGGFSSLCDPITHQLLTSDDFGSIIRTSKNLGNLRRITAVRMNYGYIKNNGANIAIYEETEDNQQEISGIVALWDRYAGEGKTFTRDAKITFGKDFNIGNNSLLAAVRVPASGGCQGPPVTPINRIAYFRRSDTTNLWEFKQFIETPDPTEDFGVSITMNATGDMAIVGAPKFPSGRGTGATPGIGGSIYLYVRSEDGNSWNLQQKVTDPFASQNTKGAFGYFVSSDRQFLVVSASANQNNVLDVKPGFIGNTLNNDRPKVVFMSINQENKSIDTVNAQIEIQPGDLPAQQYLDPCLGANLSMAFEDEGRSTLKMILSSPMNQISVVKDMTL
jgi:hypothetical protein